jgi:hypothetical protein
MRGTLSRAGGVSRDSARGGWWLRRRGMVGLLGLAPVRFSSSFSLYPGFARAIPEPVKEIQNLDMKPGWGFNR